MVPHTHRFSRRGIRSQRRNKPRQGNGSKDRAQKWGCSRAGNGLIDEHQQNFVNDAKDESQVKTNAETVADENSQDRSNNDYTEAENSESDSGNAKNSKSNSGNEHDADDESEEEDDDDNNEGDNETSEIDDGEESKEEDGDDETNDGKGHGDDAEEILLTMNPVKIGSMMKIKLTMKMWPMITM